MLSLGSNEVASKLACLHFYPRRRCILPFACSAADNSACSSSPEATEGQHATLSALRISDVIFSRQSILTLGGRECTIDAAIPDALNGSGENTSGGVSSSPQDSTGDEDADLASGLPLCGLGGTTDGWNRQEAVSKVSELKGTVRSMGLIQQEAPWDCKRIQSYRVVVVAQYKVRPAQDLAQGFPA